MKREEAAVTTVAFLVSIFGLSLDLSLFVIIVCVCVCVCACMKFKAPRTSPTFRSPVLAAPRHAWPYQRGSLKGAYHTYVMYDTALAGLLPWRGGLLATASRGQSLRHLFIVCGTLPCLGDGVHCLQPWGRSGPIGEILFFSRHPSTLRGLI